MSEVKHFAFYNGQAGAGFATPGPPPLPTVVDDQTGAVSFARETSGEAHDVTDEVARRAWLSGAQVLAVRGPDVPGGGEVAAILRYPL